MEQISDIVRIIRNNLSTEERNLLTKKRVIPIEGDLASDLTLLREAVRLRISHTQEDFRSIENSLKDLMISTKKQERMVQKLISLIPRIGSDILRSIILDVVTSAPCGYSELINFYSSLNEYLKTILFELEMLFPTHMLKENIRSSKYYNVLNPIYEIGDKFIPYFYFSEIGGMIVRTLRSKMDIQSLSPIIDYTFTVLNISEDNQIFTSLDRQILELTRDLLLIFDNGTEIHTERLTNFTESVADYLNGKIWILLTAISSVGEDTKDISMEKLFGTDFFRQFSMEYFTSPFFILYTQYFEKHRKLSWVEYDSKSDKAKGLITYLTELLFSLFDHGVEIDLSLLEGLFEILQMPAMDWRGIRYEVLEKFLFVPFEYDSWMKQQFTTLFNFQVERISRVGDDKFKDFLIEGKVEAENFQEFRFLELLFKIMRLLEF